MLASGKQIFWDGQPQQFSSCIHDAFTVWEPKSQSCAGLASVAGGIAGGVGVGKPEDGPPCDSALAEILEHLIGILHREDCVARGAQLENKMGDK